MARFLNALCGRQRCGNSSIKMETMEIRLSVNRVDMQVDVEARTSLADCLRDQLRLTGTHLGCEHGVCGACTILLDGRAVRACLVLAVQARGRSVITIEGLSNDEELSAIQEAFRKHHALQCGFCTPGAIVTAHALLSEDPDADESRITELMSGNFCRCTGYKGIIKAVVEARDVLNKKATENA